MSKCYWKLTDEEYEFIKGEVIHIFEKYNIKCIPVSGFEIAPPVLVHKIGAECPQDIYEAFDISFEAAVYAYKYYCSWKSRFEQVKRLADYEIRLLALFKKSA